MNEPLFGSAAPSLWPPMALPVFGYPAPAFARAPGTPMAQAGARDPSGVGASAGWSAPAIPNGPNLGFPVAANPFGVSGALAIASQEMAVYSVPALLAAVALRRGQPLGPTNDQEIEDFLYDAFELLPGTSEVEVRCEGSRVTLTGSVPHKRLKRDAGEIAWNIPGVNDVQNNVTIATKRRSRSPSREPEAATVPARKQT